MVGKPSREFFDRSVQTTGLDRANVVRVGDDLEGDVAGARAARLRGVLVRTGRFRPDQLERFSVAPDLVVDSVRDLPAVFGCHKLADSAERSSYRPAAMLKIHGAALIRWCAANGVVVVGLLVCARSASADCHDPQKLGTCIDADGLWPHAGAGRFQSIGATETSAPGQFSFGLVTSWARKPVVLNDASPILRFEALCGKRLLCRDPDRCAVFASLTARECEDEMALCGRWLHAA